MASPRAMLVWATFARLEEELGHGVSVRQVGSELGLSHSAVHEHALRLLDEGLLKRLGTGGFGAKARCPRCQRVIA